MASSEHTFTEVLGSGAFGVVWLVRTRNGRKFALKKIKLVDESKCRSAQQEVEVLKELRHDYVVAYVENWKEDNFVCILTEYCAGGDLEQFLQATGKPVPEDLLLVWLWQMACGLEYMHLHESGRCILHRDLKPSNVYFTGDGTVRLGDMGIAKVREHFHLEKGTFCGTLPYMSPELLSGKPYCAKTDVWGLGCCVVEMACLEMAYEATSPGLLMLTIVHGGRPKLPEAYDKQLDFLVGKMLCKDSRHRLSSSELLEHKLMKNVEIKGMQPVDLLEKHDLKKYLALKRKRTQTATTATGASGISLGSTLTSVDQKLKHNDSLQLYYKKLEHRRQGRVLSSMTTDTGFDSSEAESTVVDTDMTFTESESSERSSGYSTMSAAESMSECSNNQLILSGRRGRTEPPPPTQKSKDRRDDGASSASAAAPEQESFHATMLREISVALTTHLGKEKVDQIVVVVKTSSNSRELMRRVRSVLGDNETQTRMITIAATYMVLLEVTINSRSSR